MHHFEAHELADSWELRAGLLDADPADASISACLRECAAALRSAAVPDVQPKGTDADEVEELKAQNRAVAQLIIDNDKAGAVKWAQGLFTSLDDMEVRAQSPAPVDEMLEPLIYAAMMHNGKPKTVAEFERAAANVADMLHRRAAVTCEKPVASIYISADGSREFDDWRVDLLPGNHQLFTAPRSAQPQPEQLPHPGTPEAEEMIDKLLAEYSRPANMKNAARAGYMAARRLLQNAAMKSAVDAALAKCSAAPCDAIGVGGVREVLKELEWSGTGAKSSYGGSEPCCPCCEEFQHDGHLKRCKLGAALKSLSHVPVQGTGGANG